MPPKTNLKYTYQKHVIRDHVYQMPDDIEPGSRRWRMWRRWQDRGLSLPSLQPAVDIKPGTVTPWQPFTEKRLQAA
jgi:hypothetical protein